MNLFKKTITSFLIFVVLASGFFLPKETYAQVKLGDVAAEWAKELAILAAGDLTIKGICKLYAKVDIDFQKILGDLIGKGLDKLGPIGEILGGGDEEGEGLLGGLLEGLGGDLLGGLTGGSEVPVKDKNLEKTNIEQSKKERETIRYEECVNFLREVVLAAYKKRMLDKMTDMTIAWIKGDDEEPLFVTDPKEFHKQTVNEVGGQLIEETSLANLCYEPLKLRLQFQLTAPTRFSERVSCTLEQVGVNIAAFRNDFQNGGWLAYQEVLKPQNNRWGIETMVEGEKQRREYEASLAAQYELGAASGFLGQKSCVEWKATKNTVVGGKEYEAGKSISGETFWTKSPDDQPYTGRVQKPVGSDWRCVKSQTVTPGQVASEALTKSINSDFDFIINSDDLSTYGTAILSTILNQLIMKGIDSGKGLFAVKSREDSEGRTDCSHFEEGSELRYLCEQSSGSEENFDYTLNSVLTSELENVHSSLEGTFSTLYTISSTLLSARENNERLITKLDELDSYQKETGDVYDENVSSKYDVAVERRSVFNNKRQSINALESSMINTQENLDNINTTDADEVIKISGEVNELSDEVEVLASEIFSLNEKIHTLLTEVSLNLQLFENN